MSPVGLNSLGTRMKVLSSNCHNFKELSALAKTIRSLYNTAYFKNVFLTNLTTFSNINRLLIPWYIHPV